jgi:MFS superfamily sulfate permease-like transporter
VAGLVLTAILAPAGMDYDEASRLPAIYGLSATILPLLAYAVFRPGLSSQVGSGLRTI